MTRPKKNKGRRAGKKRRKPRTLKGGQRNMPKRYVQMIPKELRFKERSGDKIEGKEGHVDWKKFLEKVEDNPKWVTTYKLGESMDAIWDAYYEAEKDESNILILAEEDWTPFEECCQNPRVMFIGQGGPQTIPGWGIHPQLNRQMLVFPRAVIKAMDEKEWKEFKKAEEEKASAEEPNKDVEEDSPEREEAAA